jgi:hypothetical protein
MCLEEAYSIRETTGSNLDRVTGLSQQELYILLPVSPLEWCDGSLH